MARLEGKTAIVTGGAKGIGRHYSQALAAEGARVMIADIADGKDLAAEIAGRHGANSVASIKFDVSDEKAIKNVVAQTIERFGQIDILVCNAASNPYFGPMGNMSDEQFNKILQNNIVSNHWLIQMVAPEMRARKSGSITIISSIGGLRGTEVLGAYAISKAADMQLTRNLAAEFGPDNVRVNTIAPGLIKTDFAKALWDNPEILKRSTERAPLRRIGEPDEIAGMAVFLAAPAGAFTTGQTFVIDGGQTVV